MGVASEFLVSVRRNMARWRAIVKSTSVVLHSDVARVGEGGGRHISPGAGWRGRQNIR